MPRSVRDHARNIRDEAIRACAEIGGVIAVNGITAHRNEIGAIVSELQGIGK